ncbi:hypothetical protein BH18THE1_BH18THE1_12210 [soil metagenome]
MYKLLEYYDRRITLKHNKITIVLLDNLRMFLFLGIWRLTLQLAFISFFCYREQEIVTLDHATHFLREAYSHTVSRNSHSLLITFKGFYDLKTLS